MSEHINIKCGHLRQEMQNGYKRILKSVQLGAINPLDLSHVTGFHEHAKDCPSCRAWWDKKIENVSRELAR